MKYKSVWVLEYTMETKVPILHSYQAAVSIDIYDSKEKAEYHANLTTEQYKKQGWKVVDEVNGKSYHFKGCNSHGYRITEKRVNTL